MNLLPTEGGEGGEGGGEGEKGWKRVKSNESGKAPALNVKHLNNRPGHSIE